MLEWGGWDVVKCIYIIICRYSPLKIQCTAILLDRMNLKNCPPPPLPHLHPCVILFPMCYEASYMLNGCGGNVALVSKQLHKSRFCRTFFCWKIGIYSIFHFILHRDPGMGYNHYIGFPDWTTRLTQIALKCLIHCKTEAKHTYSLSCFAKIAPLPVLASSGVSF